MKKMFFLFVFFFVLAGTTSALASNEVIVKNSEIADMVQLCIKNNGIKNPDVIHPGFNPIWQFPDNPDFQFYDLDPISEGQSLWRRARYFLMITYDYHKNVHALEYSDPKTITATAMIIDSEENSNSVESSDEKNNYKTIWSITVFALFFISLTVLITRNLQDKKNN